MICSFASPHLEHVPGLGSLTARSLTGRDLEVLGGHTDGALDAQLLALGTLDELGADLLQRLHFAAGEGDADLVDLWGVKGTSLLGVLERHGGGDGSGGSGGVVVGVRCGLRSRLWYG